MIVVRIMLLIFFSLSSILSAYWKLYFFTIVGIFGIICTIIWILMRDYGIDIDGMIENRRKENIKKTEEKMKNNKESIDKEYIQHTEKPKLEEIPQYKQEEKFEGIVIDKQKLIIYLLIIIIIMLAIPLYKDYKEEQTKNKYINEAIDGLNKMYKGN